MPTCRSPRRMSGWRSRAHRCAPTWPLRDAHGTPRGGCGCLSQLFLPRKRRPSTMSRANLDVRATQLREQGVPFVRARVVLAERPTSAKAGDEAIIHADGSIEGFVGGTCAETTVRAQSLMLLDTKEPLLLRITPTEEPGQLLSGGSSGTLSVHNPCLSGGTLEIFLDPVVPPPLVQVLGDGPIATALVGLVERLDYRAAAVDRQTVGGA